MRPSWWTPISTKAPNDDAGQLHAFDDIADFMDLLRKGEFLRGCAGIQARLGELLQDVGDGRKAGLLADIALRFDLSAELRVSHQFPRRDAEIRRHPVYQGIALRMDRTAVQGIRRIRNAQETGALLIGLGAEAGDLQQLLAGGKGPVCSPVGHDIRRQHRSDAGDVAEQVGARGVELHADAVDAGFDREIEFFPEQALIDVVLVLADAEGFRVDLDQFG